MKAFKLTILILGLAITGVLQGCSIGEASNPSADEIQAGMPVPVQVALPSRMDVYAKYRATSTIASDADAPVLARVPGQVTQLLVEEGDQVERGQLLARLDGESIAARPRTGRNLLLSFSRRRSVFACGENEDAPDRRR